MLQPIITDNLAAIQAICVAHKVARLFVFGSVCTDKFRADSDVDFIVGFLEKEIPEMAYADNYFNFIDAMQALLGRPVDLVPDQPLQNPFFAAEVEKTKTLLYEPTGSKIFA